MALGLWETEEEKQARDRRRLTISAGQEMQKFNTRQETERAQADRKRFWSFGTAALDAFSKKRAEGERMIGDQMTLKNHAVEQMLPMAQEIEGANADRAKLTQFAGHQMGRVVSAAPLTTEQQLTERYRAMTEEGRPGVGDFGEPHSPSVIDKAAKFAFDQANRRVFEPTELVGGRAIQALEPVAAQVATAPIPGVGQAVQGLQAAEALGVDIPGAPRVPGLDRFKFSTSTEQAGRLPGDVQAAANAAVGDEQDSEILRQRLTEIGLPERIIAGVILDPLNLIPGLGFGSQLDTLRFFRGLGNIRRGAGLGDEAAEYTVKVLRDAGETAVDAAPVGAVDGVTPRLAGEGASQADFTPPGSLGSEGLDTGTPIQRFQGKLRTILLGDEKDWARIKAQRQTTNRERGFDFKGRVAAAEAEGVPYPEAVRRARGAFKGEMPDIFRQVDATFEPEEIEAFWGGVRGLQSHEEDNIIRILDRLATSSDAESRVLRAWERELLTKAGGEDFAELMGKVSEIVPEGRRLADDLNAAYPSRVKGAPKPDARGTGGVDVPGTADLFQKASLKSPRRQHPLFRVLDEIFLMFPTVKSAFDMSVHLRQMWKFATNPRRFNEWRKAIPVDAQAIKSGEYASMLDNALRNDAEMFPVKFADGHIADTTFGEMAEGPMNIFRPVPGIGEDITKVPVTMREEAFPGGWAQNLFGVRQSSRGFTSSANSARSYAGKDIIKGALKRNKAQFGSEFVTVEELHDIGDILLRSTGIGDIGGNTWIGGLIKHLMWAPGLRTSMPQLVWRAIDPRPLIPGALRRGALRESTSLIARKEAAETLAAWFAAGTAGMTIAELAGANVGWDRTATNFGKINVPGSRQQLNIWGTDSILARTIGRVIEGEGQDEFGNVRDISWDTGLEEYFRSGAQDVIGQALNIKEGGSFTQDYTGWNADSALAFAQEQAPLFFQDVRDAYENGGVLPATIAAPFQFGGASISSYSAVNGEFRAIPQYNTNGVLDANKEREITNFLRDVTAWEESEINKRRLDPKEYREQHPVEDAIRYVAYTEGKDQDVMSDGKTFADWAVLIHKAGGQIGAGNYEFLNPEWVIYLRDHEEELKRRYGSKYDSNPIQAAFAAQESR